MQFASPITQASECAQVFACWSHFHGYGRKESSTAADDRKKNSDENRLKAKQAETQAGGDRLSGKKGAWVGYCEEMFVYGYVICGDTDLSLRGFEMLNIWISWIYIPSRSSGKTSIKCQQKWNHKISRTTSCLFPTILQHMANSYYSTVCHVFIVCLMWSSIEVWLLQTI